MSIQLQTYIIEGVTLEGATFRPSDWIERLIDTLTSYGVDRRARRGAYPGRDRRVQKIDFLCAQMIEGRKCLVVDARLSEANPEAFRFLQEFARTNHLRIRESMGAACTVTSA